MKRNVYGRCVVAGTRFFRERKRSAIVEKEREVRDESAKAREDAVEGLERIARPSWMVGIC